MSDDATGVPDFLWNYFNPSKSSKTDSEGAGGFGCGAISINAVADVYRIVHKEKNQDAVSITVKVIRNNGVITGTEVLNYSTVDRKEIGFTIDIIREIDEKQIPEINAMVTSASLESIIEIELLKNPKLSVINQGQISTPNPKIEIIDSNPEMEFIRGYNADEKKLWVKNLHITDDMKLPPFIYDLMNKSEQLSFNYNQKIDPVRTRNGLTETGENEAKVLLYKNYMRSLAKRIFNGDKIYIPGIDNNLSQAFNLYRSSRIEILADNLQSGAIKDAKLFDNLQPNEWISLLLNTKFENNGIKSSLIEYFQTLEIIRKQAELEKNLSETEYQRIIDEAIAKMTPEELEKYEELQKSKLANQTYGSLKATSSINLGMSKEKIEMAEKLIPNSKLQDYIKTESEKRNIKLFTKLFEALTKNMRDFDNQPIEVQLQWVTRQAGTDYAGSKDYESGLFVCKYNIANIKDLDLNSTSDQAFNAMYEVIIHELAHHLDVLARFNSQHDEIFKEMMRVNFARLLESAL